MVPVLQEEYPMRKRVKKLALMKETVRLLNGPVLGQALGAVSDSCYEGCTTDATQTTGYCPTNGCQPAPTGGCPSNRVVCR